MKLRTVAAVACVTFPLAACGGTTSTGSSGSGGTKLQLSDDSFEPSTVSGEPGKKLTLQLENTGNKEHNFTIDDQSVDQDVEAGESASVTVTVPQSGTVAFYCKYHKAAGMTGTLSSGGGAAGGGGTSTGDDMMNGTSTKDDSGGIGY
ncbi:MAG: hypothetical protein QOK32_929 [Gaiellaceae bacterium]|jgi:plastocyanin|nr:hypothetical protein [Gaiellaceae bacterium]